MKSNRTLTTLIVCLLVLAIAALGFIAFRNHEISKHEVQEVGKYTYITGAVTTYDAGPTAYDGSIIFKIDGTPVNIGGGLRMVGMVDSDGKVDLLMQVGDKVKAKLIKDNYGLTIFKCPDCYVKKQTLFQR
jgi:hypothetical protein